MSTCPPAEIVVAVDFGEASARAVEQAGTLAAAFAARLVAVHAETIDLPPYFTPEQIDVLEDGLRTARGRAHESLMAFVASHTAAPAVGRIAETPAVDAVLDAAARADLIVVGTHGRRGPRRWWLGSVAERLVREAPVPVMVVHARPEAPWTDAARPLNILLAASAEAHGHARLWADTLARTFAGLVHEGPPVERCDAATIQRSHLIVVALPGEPLARSVHGATITLTRSCSSPLLFVPEAVASRTHDPTNPSP